MGVGEAGWADPGPAPLALTWDAPANCPTVAQVAGDVQRTLADLSRPSSPLTVAAQVAGGPGQTWEGHLVLNVHGAQTKRRIQAESCQALASVAALIIAVALDDASDQPMSTVAAPPPVVATRPAPPPPIGRGASYFLGANGVVDYDTMPSPPGAGLEVAVGRKWAVGRLRPGWMVGATLLRNLQPAVNSVLGPVTGDFWSFGLSGRGCLGIAVASVDIGPCLGGEAVAMHATNDGWAYVGLVTESHQWFSFLGSLVGSYRASRSVDVVLRADLVLPTARPTFDIYTNVLPAYVVPAAAFRSALGVAFRFP